VEGDAVPRDDDEEADMISVAGVVDEVAAEGSATVGDEAADVAADGAAAAGGAEGIGSGRRRIPPALMLRWTLPIARLFGIHSFVRRAG
jgi:hypothetical protein